MINTSHFRRCLLILPILALITVGTVDADDGWRRTAQGWERISPTAKSQTQTVAKNDPLHPGQLGILQVVASCLVLGLFAGQRSS